MAREILFKAKRVDNGEWVEGSFITGVFCRLGQDIPYIFCPEKADYDCFEDFSETNGIFEVQSETICQYTGLTDKNGKKIWENDVVFIDAYSYIEPEDEVMGVVAYSDTYACYGILGNKFVPISDCMGSYKTIYHAMGNIFDNPELLEG